MNLAARIAYGTAAWSIRAYQRLFMDLRIYRRETIPPGPKIYVFNHITSTDPWWLIGALPEPLHIVVGPAYQSRCAAWLLDRFEQVNAMPEHRSNAVTHAAELLNRGQAVLIAPEGDIQPVLRLGHFYAGAAKIYRLSRAPIVPVALLTPTTRMRACRWLDMEVEGRRYQGLLALRGPFCINIGTPIAPDVTEGGGAAEVALITNTIKQRIQDLLDDIRTNRCPDLAWR